MANLFEVNRVNEHILRSTRIDGRAFDSIRDITIETGVTKNADGSALVTLGKTKVIAGVKAIIDTPFPDTPGEGSISVNVELSPMADASFEAGPPNELSIEVSRVVDRGIRESKGIDFKGLSILNKEKAWFLYLDIYIINNDGNLIDAVGIASVAALKNCKIPELDSSFEVIHGGASKALSFIHTPITFTFVKVQGKIILDPSSSEEDAASARFSLAITQNLDVCAIQKGIGGGFTFEEIEYMVNVARNKYKDVARYLNR